MELATRSFRAIAGIPGLAQVDATDWRATPNWLSIPEHLKIQVCYEGSPICIPDGTPAPDPEPPRFMPSTRPGARAPHAWLADGSSTLDLFGDGFTLLRLGERPPDAGALLRAAQARRVPLREIAIADPEVAALYERALVLVRPDGHVAWRGDALPADAAGIVERMRGAATRAQSAGANGRARGRGAALAMDSDPHPGTEAHVHGGRVHVHASVDHLAGAAGTSARLGIRLDSVLMEKLGVAADAVVRLATERGRSMLARLDPPLEADAGTGIVRLDRFVRQALKAHLNESIEIETAAVGAGQAHRAAAGGRCLDGA